MWGALMKKESFAPIPNSILRRSDLSPGSKLCYGRLLQYQGNREAAYPSIAALAEELAVTPRQTQKYIKILEAGKFIKINRSPGNRNSYTILNDNLDTNDSSPLNNNSVSNELSFIPDTNDSSGATKENIEKNNKRKIYTGKALNDRFLKFWNLYPKRNGKKLGKIKAEKLFNGLSVSNQEQILTAVKKLYRQWANGKGSRAIHKERLLARLAGTCRNRKFRY